MRNDLEVNPQPPSTQKYLIMDFPFTPYRVIQKCHTSCSPVWMLACWRRPCPRPCGWGESSGRTQGPHVWNWECSVLGFFHVLREYRVHSKLLSSRTKNSTQFHPCPESIWELSDHFRKKVALLLQIPLVRWTALHAGRSLAHSVNRVLECERARERKRVKLELHYA